MARLEERLATVEERLERLERIKKRQEPAPAQPSAIDFTLIGKSVLMVAGAYVLRALTEMGYLAEIAGIVLGLLYAFIWMWIADRSLARGRRTVALFDAGTAALIVGALTWEATVRFHALPLPAACTTIVVASLDLMLIARRGNDPVLVVIAAGMAGVTCIGLAIGTADVVPPIVAISIISILAAIQRAAPSYVTVALAAVAGGLAVPLIVIPRDTFIAATALMIVTACMYSIAIRRTDSLLAAAGAWTGAVASLLTIQLPALPIAWAAAALASAAIARQRSWDAMSVHAALWAVAAAVVSFRSTASLFAVALLTVIALSITPRGRSRLVLVSVITLTLIVGVLTLLPENSAMIRTAILAFAAIILSLLSGVVPEAAIAARIVLVIGGAKLLVEDLRGGQATTIVIALALYGGAMLIVARRRRQSATA